MQGTPKFRFDNGLELPFTSATSSKIIFSKKIENSDVNGRLEYFSNSCIVDYECIKDNAGNSVNLLLDSKETSNIYVDTETKVQYMIINGDESFASSMSILVDAEGKPILYEGDLEVSE